MTTKNVVLLSDKTKKWNRTRKFKNAFGSCQYRTMSNSQGGARNSSLAFCPVWQKVKDFCAFWKSPFWLNSRDFLGKTLISWKSWKMDFMSNSFIHFVQNLPMFFSPLWTILKRYFLQIGETIWTERFFTKSKMHWHIDFFTCNIFSVYFFSHRGIVGFTCTKRSKRDATQSLASNSQLPRRSHDPKPSWMFDCRLKVLAQEWVLPVQAALRQICDE